MKEFIEKLIERLEAVRDEGTNIIGSHYFDDGVDAAIKTVEQVAEEYNNGWIPCSERLPGFEEDVLLWLSSYETQMGYRAIYIDGESFYTYNSQEFVDVEDVLAWQPLPEPFKPEG